MTNEPKNAPRAAPARPGNGSQNADRQAINEASATAATAAQGNRAVVASWPRNACETVQVALDRYQSCDTIDVRCWFKAADGSLRPTRTGITLTIGHLPQLAAALAAALTVVSERGPIDDDNRGPR